MAGGITGNPEGVDASWLQDLHAPAAFLCGDRDTNGLARVRNDFAAIPAGVPVFFGLLAGVGHTDEFSQPNGGRWGRIVVAWLRWQLADDATFEPSFTGADCEFCKGDWTAMKQADRLTAGRSQALGLPRPSDWATTSAGGVRSLSTIGGRVLCMAALVAACSREPRYVTASSQDPPSMKGSEDAGASAPVPWATAALTRVSRRLWATAASDPG